MQIQENKSLKAFNTFGIDVKTKYFAEYQSVQELKEILVSDIVKDNPVLHIGSGSNLLFLSDYKGIILHSQLKFIENVQEDEESVLLRVGSGIVWDDFVAYCVEKNFYGVENLSLIPGEIGASAVQNIGAYGMEVKDVIETVEAIEIKTRQARIFTNQECAYDYRQSIFKGELKGEYIITAVNFRLKKQAAFMLDYSHLTDAVLQQGEINLATIRKTIIQIRQSKLPDPKITGNAGSFFMNPIVSKEKFQELQLSYPSMPHYTVSEAEEKIPAGWMIEQCGFKGKAFGNVAVHDKQALVLVNLGGATGKEVADLSAEIQKSVWDKFGVEISAEVNFIL